MNPASYSMTTQTASSRWIKPLRFGLYGALGCLLAALLGELWLLLAGAGLQGPRAIALVIDTSGSMAGSKLDEVKTAAKGFVRGQNLGRDRTAVVHFDSSAQTDAPLSHDAATLENALDQLMSTGSTRMDAGLAQGITSLQDATEARSILLFTDGEPDSADTALQAANDAHAKNIQVVAVATGDADRDFLAKLTGDPNLVFWASNGQFDTAFSAARNAIYGYQLTDSVRAQGNNPGGVDLASAFLNALKRVGVWTGLLAAGLALALLWGQANYFRRPFTPRDAFGALGAFVAGVVAGVSGQLLFALAGFAGGGAPLVATIGRVLAWAVLGALLGRGMILFVPNLDARRAWQFGALGGAAGAIGFVQLAALGSDVAGRLGGATLLGFVIGLLVVLAEVTFRRAWLHVQGSGPLSEVRFDVNLGRDLVLVGSDRSRCVVYAPEAAPVAASYGMENGRVFMEPSGGQREYLAPGAGREFGALRVIIEQPRSELESGANAELEARNAEVSAPIEAMPPVSNVAPVSPVPMVEPLMPIAPVIVVPSSIAPVSLAAAPNSSASTVLMPNLVSTGTMWSLNNPRYPIVLPSQNGTWNVGRAPENDFWIAESEISSRHARLDTTTDGLTITDLGSTNGTFVNGARLVRDIRVPLRLGDRVRLGDSEWMVG